MRHPIHKVKAFEIDEVHTLVRPSGANFDPDTLHDWPEHQADMIALARRWAAASSRGEKAS